MAALGRLFQDILRKGIPRLVLQGTLRTSLRLLDVALGIGFAGTEGIDMGANGADFTWQGPRAGILLH